MNKTEIENEVLKYFLDCLEKRLSCSTEVLFNQLENVDEEFFERIVEELVSDGLLSGFKHNTDAKLTSRGILEIEKRQLIPIEKIQHNGVIRYEALKVGFDKYNSKGYGELVSYADFNFDIDFDTSGLELNLDLLEDLGFIKFDESWDDNHSFYIEKLGIAQLQKWQKQQSFANDSAGTTNDNPQSPEENPLKSELSTTMQSQADPRKVFVVHGRNEALRLSMFEFLRSIGLEPIEWSEAIRLTRKGSPYVGDVLDTAFSVAQAIVVLMTPDDEARLIESYRGSKEPNYETELTPQPRQNVLIEAGMALGRHPDRTILVEIGDLRPISDIVGRHIIRLNNSPEKRQDIVDRLETAECAVNIKGKRDWLKVGNFELHPVSKSQNKISKTKENTKQDLSVKIQELDVKVLQRISLEAKVTIEEIARDVKLNYAYAKHSVETLMDLGYVEEIHTVNNSFFYGLTKEGRKFIVSRKIF